MSATEYTELVRDLRALPTAAPQSLRERVRALGEPEPRRALPVRRSLLVLAPACVAALLAAAAVHGVLNSGAPATPETLTYSAADHGVAGGKLVPSVRSPLVVPDSGRHQDYQASMTLRVKDLDALTEQTNEAMRVVRSFGGY